MPPSKCDSEESDWNKNLYLHQYHAKVQCQVPIRQPPSGWSNWRKELSTASKNKSVNTGDNADNTSDKMLQTQASRKRSEKITNS